MNKDHYREKAKQQGYLSRAAFKLKEVQKRYRLIKSGALVIDLGAAPGGWSEVASEIVGNKGRVLAIDRQPIQVKPRANIVALRADFVAESTPESLTQALEKENRQADVVLSDAAPDTSGIAFRDVALSQEICFAALGICQRFLKRGGHFLVKIFAGDEQAFIDECKTNFQQVKRLKPDASRKRSREFYLLCQNFLGDE